MVSTRPHSRFVALVLTSLVLTGAAAAQTYDHIANVVHVAPSGDDDTAALQDAFDTCIAVGAGCTVRLAAGTFRTHHLVIDGFEGTFEGAGAKDSIIEPYGVLTINSNENAIGLPPSAENPWPALVIFIDATMVMRDVGFSVPLEEPVTIWHALGMDFDVLSSIVIVTGARSRVDVERISMSSGAGPTFGVNVFNGLFIEGILPRASGEWGDWVPLTGHFTVTDSDFDGPDGGVVIANLVDASVYVAGNVMRGNYGPYVSDVEGSTIAMVDNEIDAYVTGFYAESGSYVVQERQSTLLITGNDLRLSQDAVGVVLLDANEVPVYEVLISRNRFALDASDTAVWGVGSIGTVVRANVVTGAAVTGIQVGGVPGMPSDEPPTARSWIVAGNDFSGLDATLAEVWLTEFSADTLLLCQGSLLDEGEGIVEACR